MLYSYPKRCDTGGHSENLLLYDFWKFYEKNIVFRRNVISYVLIIFMKFVAGKRTKDLESR